MNLHRPAGAALTALVALAALLLGACSETSSSSPPEQAPAPSGPSSSGPSSSGPSTTDDASHVSSLGPSTRTDLEPGRWAVTASGSREVPRAVVEVPEGVHGGDGHLWTVGGAPENDGWIFGYFTVSGVHVSPCRRVGGTFDTKSSPDLFVEALGAQRRTTTSPAVPVTLDGYGGLYVELISPIDLDYSTCRENGLAIFDTTTKGDRHLIVAPGVVERYWVLDVDGERVVLVGVVLPETTDAQVEQLMEMVSSVRFERS